MGDFEKALARRGLESVNFIPHLDYCPPIIRFPNRFDAELAQNFLDVVRLRFGILMRNVADVEYYVGLDDFFERGTERRDQHGRQIGNETYGVG